MIIKFKPLAILLLLFITILGLYGCNNSSKKDNTTINVALMGEPATLDPNLINGTWESRVLIDLYVGLTTRLANGKVVPAVATSWKVSDDGKVYTFKLREDAKWSDGEPVTAYDFEYSIKRMLNPETAASYANLLYIIKGGEEYASGKAKQEDVKVKALDNYKLRIELTSKASYFPELLTHTSFLPIPKHVVEKYGKAWSKPVNIVTNGAYKFVEWKPKTHIKAVKNPLFWDSANVKIDNVVYYTQEDEAALLKRYRSNEIDTIPMFSSDQYEWLQKNMKDDIHIAPYVGIYFYGINIRPNGKLTNNKVREALNMAVDRDFITQKVIKTGEKPAYSYVPYGIEGYKGAKLKWYNKDMKTRRAEAKKLLAEAGYTPSKPLEITIKYNTSLDHKKLAVAVASMWKQIGVNAKLLNQEVAVHYADLRSGHFDVARIGWIADYADPSTFIFMYTTPSSLNYSGYQNKTYDNLFYGALNASSQKEANDLYRKAEQMILDDNIIIPLYFYVSRNLVKPYIKGWEENSVDIHQTRYMSINK